MPDYTSWAGLLTPAPTQFGPDMKQVISLQKMAQEMQAQQMIMQQAQQGQNALKQAYANKDNIDPSGYLTPNAMRGLITQAPNVGLNLMQEMNKAKEADLRTRLVGEKVSDEQRNWATDMIAVPAVARRDEVFKQTGNLQLAQSEGQKTYNEGLDVVKADGRLGSAASQLSPTFDYDRAKANILGRKGIEEAAKMDLKAQEPPTPYQRALIGIKQDELTEKQRADLAREQGTKKGKEGLASAKEVAVYDADGNPIEQVAVVDDPNSPSGLKHFGTNDPVVVPEGGHIGIGAAATGALGGKGAQQQIMTIVGSGGQVAASLKNLTNLGISTNIGWLKGIGAQAPEGVADAIRKSLSGEVSSQEARALQQSWQGVSRGLSQLETFGARTGMVGLTKQAETLLPQKGDTNTNVLRSYAELRQIVEQALQTTRASPGVTPPIKARIDEILENTRRAVPFTVEDVQNLEDAKTSTKAVRDEKVRDFAKRMFQKRVSADPDEERGNKQWADAPSGTVFVDQYGNEHRKP